MDTVSAATVVAVRVGVIEGIALGGIDVGVRVAVGLETTDVAVGGSEVMADVHVAVGGAVIGVRDGPIAVGVRVEVGRAGASRLISMERAVDQAPFTARPCGPARATRSGARW